ncbi:hypothetical protein [Bacillus sp. OTU530]|uniref:hypothetical protein n=1 Tax=Bacillus sp. OTU530 TaxID=3043862 RepID=UPI00313D6D9D
MAELTGIGVIDGLKASIPSHEIACVIIDCGGTAHCGVYLNMGAMIINLLPTSPSGLLMHFIKEHNFVSRIKEEHIDILQESTDEIVSVHNANTKHF